MCVIPFGGGTNVSGALECPVEEKRTIVSLDMTQMVRVDITWDQISTKFATLLGTPFYSYSCWPLVIVLSDWLILGQDLVD